MQDYLKKIEEVIAGGPYTDTWESLSNYPVPEWYADVKFGIFIHWGVYSVPGFGSEWYPRSMYLKDTPEYAHHIKTYGNNVPVVFAQGGEALQIRLAQPVPTDFPICFKIELY